MPKSNSGRPLPPLLPLEYCTIGRAAKMLDCEPEDLLHWAEIGAIDLYLQVDTDSCIMPLSETEHTELLAEIDKQNSMAENDKTSRSASIKIGLSYMWISEDSLNEKGYDPDTEYYHLEIDTIQGLWAIEYSDLKPSLINNSDTFTPWGLYVNTSGSTFFYVDLDHEIDYHVSQLQIVKNDLERLYAAITSGEPLKNRFNDTNLAGEIHKKENHRIRPAENNSPKKALALMSLSEYVIQSARLDPQLINRPDALTTAINKELVKVGILEIDSPKTLYSAFQVAIPHRKKM